ncbi:MAG: hypothetical protein MI892_16865 [Desulfobacterales bacterium]|nr:hypothetical protein [Desulfobacterales bacterium]
MNKRFTLFCEYVHCCGKQILTLGEADSESEAKNWVSKKTIGRKRPRLLENDLILSCPVKHCPAKAQVPRYDYCEQEDPKS